jgi:hypothetical protein
MLTEMNCMIGLDAQPALIKWGESGVLRCGSSSVLCSLAMNSPVVKLWREHLQLMGKATSQDNPKLLVYENGKPLPNEVKVGK